MQKSSPAEKAMCLSSCCDASSSRAGLIDIGHCSTHHPQRTQGALVLSDDPDAPTDTTAVVLLRTGSKVSFEVNLQSARQAGIRLSSKLLRLAKTVRE